MGKRFNTTSHAQSVLGDIDESTSPDIIKDKHDALTVLEEIRDGINARIDALNDEIGD